METKRNLKKMPRIWISSDVYKLDIEPINLLEIKELVSLKKEELKTNEDKILCLIKSVHVLEGFFLRNKLSRKIDLSNNKSWISELLEEILENKINTIMEKDNIGRIIFGLVHFGVSKKQSIEAVAEWLNVSETKARDAYYLYKKFNKYKDAGDFIFSECIEICCFIEDSKKKFPNNYPHATRAFREMCEKAISVQKEIDEMLH